MWARAATSGTTPPNARCSSSWLRTREERMRAPTGLSPSMMATAVSSHDVSMPNIIMIFYKPQMDRLCLSVVKK